MNNKIKQGFKKLVYSLFVFPINIYLLVAEWPLNRYLNSVVFKHTFRLRKEDPD